MQLSDDEQAIKELARLLEQDLYENYGPIVSGDNLRKCLGFPSMAALKQAFKRKKLPITVFELKDRRGKFALVKDVAYWLAIERIRAEN